MIRLSYAVSVCAAVALSAAAFAQSAQLDLLERSMAITSGVVHNNTDAPAVVFSQLVALPEAASMQVHFGRTKLAEGCTLRTTSLYDGAMQHHTNETLSQWQHYTAWFNGPMVLVELLAAPGTAGSHVTIDSANWLRQRGDVRSICGNTDDRVLSDDPRAARHFPIGCTAWLIDDPNHTFLSAGHCVDGGVAGDVTQFNVPLSDPNGDWNHPGPEDQYAMDPASLQSYYQTIGNDWAYYGCFANTETGLTPYQAQGDSYILADAPPPVTGQPITIIGFGSVGSPVDPQWNLVQKTHTGPFAYLDGTIIGYTTDTSGGNSGSAVLDEDTGTAIGIHTNAGCDSGGGYNHGCAIHNAGLQNALANPQGVCIPNILVISLPDGAPASVLPGMALDVVFTVEAGNEEPTDQIGLVLQVDGTTTTLGVTDLGNNHYQATVPPLSCGQNVSFYLKAQGSEGGLAYLPFGAPSSQFDLAVGELEVVELFTESFEDGLPTDWSADGLWHASAAACASGDACAGGTVMYFGQESSCSYDTGGTEEGSLIAPVISLDGIFGDLVLTYCSTLVTENTGAWDYASVRVNGIEVERAGESSEWEERTVNIGSVSGDTAVISFHFDTSDSQYNDFTGWHVDDVRLTAIGVSCDDTNLCPGDVDGNGNVDANDLLMVIGDWGQTDSPADVDGDGSVNAGDILVILGDWGDCS